MKNNILELRSQNGTKITYAFIIKCLQDIYILGCKYYVDFSLHNIIVIKLYTICQ